MSPLTPHRVAGAVVVTSVMAVLGVLAGATPVLAHIDPDPPEAPAGSELSVGFTVEHGCDGSPTVGLDLRLPAGVTTPIPEPPAGWTASVAGDVVTYTGGSLPDDVEGTFRVRVTLPSTPGATIYFPFVQRCEVGEIRWIDVPGDGSTGEEPAPAMTLLEPVPTTAPPPTEPPQTTAASATTTPSTTITPSTSSTASTTAPVSTTSEPTTAPSTTVESSSTTTVAPGDESAGGNSALPVILAGTAAGGIALGGLATWQVRRRRP